MLKKLLLGLCGLFALVVILIAVFGSPLFSTAAREAVTSYGPRLTKTSVELGDVDISPWSGEGSLHGLVIGNPEGFQGDYAVRLPEASLAIDLQSVPTETIVIERIHIRQPEIHLETANGTLNLRQIQQNVSEAVAREEEAPQEPEPSTPSKKFIIEEFVLDGGRIVMAQADSEVALPTIRLNDIGAAEGGVTADRALQAILEAVLNQSTSVLEGQISNMIENPEDAMDAARSISNKVDDWFGGGDSNDSQGEQSQGQ